MDWGWNCLIYGLPVVLLVCNAWQDWKKREILPISLWIFLVAGVALNGALGYQTWNSAVGGAMVGGVMLVLSWVTRGGIGWGDGLLLCVTGVYLGLMDNLGMLLWALLLCAVFSVGLLLTRRADWKKEIPFIPFLLAAYLGELLL